MLFLYDSRTPLLCLYCMCIGDAELSTYIVAEEKIHREEPSKKREIGGNDDGEP